MKRLFVLSICLLSFLASEASAQCPTCPRHKKPKSTISMLYRSSLENGLNVL
jgi:hypothetical protein